MSTSDEDARGEQIIAANFTRGGTEKDCLAVADRYLKTNAKGIDRSHLARACKIRTQAAQAAAQKAKADLTTAKAVKKSAYAAAGKQSVLSKVAGKVKSGVSAVGSGVKKAAVAVGKQAAIVKGKVVEKATIVKQGVKAVGSGVLAGGKAAVAAARKGAGGALVKAGQAVQPKLTTTATPSTATAKKATRR
jgi:hypothetical protein